MKRLPNRRDFLISTTVAGIAATVAPSFLPAEEQPPFSGEVAIPDKGWLLWVDREASWKDDAIHLPGEFELKQLPIHAPTGGWEVLSRPPGSLPFSKAVSLPSTVEQHFWGAFGSRPYSSDEYVYQRTDSVPRNGAYEGVSWWCRAIAIPTAFQGKRILLRVRGARVRAEVYLNRKLVGYSILEELPFECDLTDAVSFASGAENVLAIRITNPGGRFDWADGNLTTWGKVSFYTGHGFGGLDRALTLKAQDAVRLSDAWVLNTADSHTLRCFAEVESRREKTENGRLEFTVLDRRTGRALVSEVQAGSAKPGVPTRYEVTLTYPHADLWDLEHPHLYHVAVRWKGDAGSRDVRTLAVGFRSFGPEGLGTDAVFRLNGRRIKIYSSISWGFWGLNGLWPIPELAAKEVTQAKALGLNCLNFHRNLGKEDVLREQDERGLLRYMEPGAGKLAIRLPGKDSPADLFSQRYMIAKCLAMVRTFRSHPSLIQWTLHNEIGGVHMKIDNGSDLTDPAVAAILRAIHKEDPSRSIVLNDGFVAVGKPQAWLAPYDDTLRTSLDGGAGGWWNNHQGASDSWYDVFYKNPRDFTYREENRKEIVEFGEMEGVAVPDDHTLLLKDIAAHGGVSYDLEDHREILAVYESFLTRWGFREAFPTAESLFLSIGRKSYSSWEQYLENVRICDDVDFAVVSGWESTAIENHSGIVDNFRNFKSDPELIRGSLLPLRPVAKQRALVVQQGTPAHFDLFLLNDTGKPASGTMSLTMTDPAKSVTVLHRLTTPTYVKDQYSYLLQEDFATPPLNVEGIYAMRFALDSALGSTQTRELLIVDAKRALPRPLRVGVEGIPLALRRRVASISGVELHDFDRSQKYDVLVTSGLDGVALANDKIGDSIGDEQQPTSVTETSKAAPKVPGKVSDELLAAAHGGTPLLVIAQRDELADGIAKQLAAGGAFTYKGQVGDFRAPWMGNWYFLRSHPSYAGLPQNQAMSIFFQVDGSHSNGLLVDGPGVEIIVGYSRDHDRNIGAGTFTASYGRGTVLFQRVPDMHPLMQQRWLINALGWLDSKRT